MPLAGGWGQNIPDWFVRPFCGGVKNSKFLHLLNILNKVNQDRIETLQNVSFT